MDIRGRHTGVLAEWNDERGFGFLDAEGTRTFVHISAFNPAGGRPQSGDVVQFGLGSGPDGRPRAVRASRMHPTPGTHSRGAHRGPVDLIAFVPVLLFALLVFVVITVLDAPLWCATFYLAMSLFTYLVYSWDKRAAVEGRWRTRESSLQLAALLGGWPGAVVAQQVLRHKNRKQSFQVVFWLAAVANMVCFLVLTAAPWRSLLGAG